MGQKKIPGFSFQNIFFVQFSVYSENVHLTVMGTLYIKVIYLDIKKTIEPEGAILGGMLAKTFLNN